MGCCCGGGEAATRPEAGPPRPEPAIQLTAPEVVASFSRKPPPQGCVRFSYQDLQAATGDFADNAVLGEGGFGRVYRGTLEDGKAVAIKCLDRMGLQGNKEFNVEVSMLGRLRHPNLVTLLGICTEGDHRLAVFDFMAGGSLRDRLDAGHRQEEPAPGHVSPPPRLLWSARVHVALGAARGLAYLHEEVSPGLIHRDVKSSNVLIDGRHEARVADFGLAHHTGTVGGVQAAAYEVQPSNDAEMLTGTFGYSSPEWLREGKVSQASDVFAFGVVMLELLTGREPVDASRPAGCQNLVDDVRPALQEISELQANLDEALEVESVPVLQLAYFAQVADFCLQVDPRNRPRMSVVVEWLEKVQSWRDVAQPAQSGGGARPTILSLMDAFAEPPPLGAADHHYLGFRTVNDTPAAAGMLHPLDTAQEGMWADPTSSGMRPDASDSEPGSSGQHASESEDIGGRPATTQGMPLAADIVATRYTVGDAASALSGAPWHLTAGSQHPPPITDQGIWRRLEHDPAAQGGLGGSYASWANDRHDAGLHQTPFSSPVPPSLGNPWAPVPPSPSQDKSCTAASTPPASRPEAGFPESQAGRPAAVFPEGQESTSRAWGSTVYPEPSALQQPPAEHLQFEPRAALPCVPNPSSSWVSFAAPTGPPGRSLESSPQRPPLMPFPAGVQWAPPGADMYGENMGDAAHLSSTICSPLQAGVRQMSAAVPSPRRAPPPPPSPQVIWGP